MKFKALILGLLVATTMTSCYDDYTADFDVTATYFASQQPLRTVVAESDMTIKVGVAISGKREVDVNDWATFAIDESLLDGTRFTLLPETHYTLSSADKMVVSNPNLPIADVVVSFTEEFYNDPNSVNEYYALPFKITDHNQSTIITDADGVAKDYSIVAVKMIGEYHGTYYTYGTMTNKATEEVVKYNAYDMSANITRKLSSLSRYTVRRAGFANRVAADAEALDITIAEDGTVSMVAGGATAIANASVVLDESGSQPIFELSYEFVDADGATQSVVEKLQRRQDPVLDLRFEEWK